MESVMTNLNVRVAKPKDYSSFNGREFAQSVYDELDEIEALRKAGLMTYTPAEIVHERAMKKYGII